MIDIQERLNGICAGRRLGLRLLDADHEGSEHSPGCSDLSVSLHVLKNQVPDETPRGRLTQPYLWRTLQGTCRMAPDPQCLSTWPAVARNVWHLRLITAVRPSLFQMCEVWNPNGYHSDVISVITRCTVPLTSA